MYLFTQLCKMLVLATFFPTTEVASGSLDVIGVGANYKEILLSNLMAFLAHLSR